MRALTLAVAFGLVSSPALAAEHHCSTLAEAQKMAGQSTVTPLTRAEYHFAQGVYILNPRTPSGLPLGDNAILLRPDKSETGAILWVMGDKVCDPMAAPKKLLEYLAQIRGSSKGEDAL